MAKKNKAQDQEGKKSHTLLYTFIVLFIIIFWLAIFAIFIRLDIGGLGTMLRPALGDIPIVNQVLPKVPDEELAEEKDYPYTNLPDAIKRIKELEAQLAEYTDSKDDSDKTIESLQKEIDRLKVFEDNQKQLEEQKDEFDKNVVFADEAPDIEEYKKYYEQIDPDNAAKLYDQVIKQLQFDASLKEKADMFCKMKPKDAAKILEEMTADTDSVAKILMSMESKFSSLILAEMDTTNAAKITKKMLSIDEERKQQLQQ